MVGRYTVVVRAAYCVLVRCTVWQGGVVCGRAVYCVLG